MLLCRPADVDFALYVLPDSDNDDIQIITDPSVISQFPNLSDEAACTSNCLFKRSKDNILDVATTSQLFGDFTNIVALWSQDSVDTATGAQSVSCWSSSGCTTSQDCPHCTAAGDRPVCWSQCNQALFDCVTASCR